jgi:gluconolactonase
MSGSRSRVEQLYRGCGFAEGPVVVGGGQIAFCDGTHGRLLRYAGGEVAELASVGGAANGLAPGADGSLYVARIAPWHALNGSAPPGVLRVDRDMRVETVATASPRGPFVAPNDVAFGPDGRLYLTDSGDPDFIAPVAPGRIFALGEAGVDEVAELEPCYVNGIAFDGEGAMLWTESATRRVCRQRDGVTRVVATLAEPDLPDGLALADDGRIFVAAVTSRAVVVLSPEGATVDRIDVGAEPTNCAFDGSVLIVTASTDSSGDPGTGMLLAVDTDARPAAVHTGSVRWGRMPSC